MEMYKVQSYSNLKYGDENQWFITIIKFKPQITIFSDYPNKDVEQKTTIRTLL
jgi:hypothetical protein